MDAVRLVYATERCLLCYEESARAFVILCALPSGPRLLAPEQPLTRAQAIALTYRLDGWLRDDAPRGGRL